jgi:hypothetical protein
VAGSWPGEHRRELPGLDLAVEAGLSGGVAGPLSGGLALAGVVVLSAFGHLVEVVALLAGAELSDGEHPRGTSVESAERPRFLGK